MSRTGEVEPTQKSPSVEQLLEAIKKKAEVYARNYVKLAPHDPDSAMTEFQRQLMCAALYADENLVEMLAGRISEVMSK